MLRLGHIALAGLLLSCACSNRDASEREWQKARTQIHADEMRLRNEERLRICMAQAADGGPIWAGALYLSPHEPSIDSQISHYDPSLHERVIAIYNDYNDLARRYNQIEAQFGRLHQRIAPHLLRDLLAGATRSVARAVELNRQNRLLVHAIPVPESSPSAEEAYLDGPMFNIVEVAAALAYVKYLQDHDAKSFGRAMDRLLNATGGHGWRRPTPRLDQPGLPNLGGPDATAYAMMLYYALDRDMESSEISASLLLYRRTIVSQPKYYPVRDLYKFSPSAAQSWTTIFTAIGARNFEPDWRCSILFGIAADWLEILAETADYNRDTKLREVAKGWTETLLPVAEALPDRPAWAKRLQETAQKLRDM